MAPRILIVASGLRGRNGHNLGYTRVVQETFRQRGAEVVVFANQNLEELLRREAGYLPVFSLGTYDLPPGKGRWSDLRYIYKESAIYAEDLRRALDEHGPFDLTFCHTVADFELIGWHRYVSQASLSGHLMVLERLTPGFSRCPRWKTRFHPYWRMKPHYLNALHRRLGTRFHLLTDSELLSIDYARVYPHPIVTVPIPLRPLPLPDTRPKSEPTRVGYVGDTRPAKGFRLLPDVVREVRKMGTPAVFVIHCPRNEYAPTARAEGLDELEEMSRDDKQLVLVSERLSDDDYISLVASLDVVLHPYTDPHFREGTSNVFTEALALGKVVVVPEDTWMAHELGRSGAGVAFRRGDARDLAARIEEVVGRRTELTERARRFAPAWRERHRAESLVGAISERAGIKC